MLIQAMVLFGLVRRGELFCVFIAQTPPSADSDAFRLNSQKVVGAGGVHWGGCHGAVTTGRLPRGTALEWWRGLPRGGPCVRCADGGWYLQPRGASWRLGVGEWHDEHGGTVERFCGRAAPVDCGRGSRAAEER